MALNYGDTFEEFESMLENLIDEKFILDGLASFGILPQKTFSIRDIKFIKSKTIRLSENNQIDKEILIKEFDNIQKSFDNSLIESEINSFEIPIKNVDLVDTVQAFGLTAAA